MWVRSAAIRPVPPYAQLPLAALGRAEAWLSEDESSAEARLNAAFERFERAQPALSAHVGGRLTRLNDEVALALGYFLTLVVWLAFEEAFDSRLGVPDETQLRGVEQSLDLDEELRGADPAEAVDSDDVVAMEQPHALLFIHEHIDTALEEYPEEADVDEVHGAYRVLLVQVLALSYAVSPPDDYAGLGQEICA